MDVKLKKRLQAAEVAIAQALALAPAVDRPEPVELECHVDSDDWMCAECDENSVQFSANTGQVVLNRESTTQLRDWLTQFLEATDGQED